MTKKHFLSEQQCLLYYSNFQPDGKNGYIYFIEVSNRNATEEIMTDEDTQLRRTITHACCK